MTLYDRYLLRRLFLVMAQVLLSLVLLVNVIDFLVTRQGSVMRYQVPWNMVIHYYVSFTPTILFEYQAAAVAVLLSVLLVLGRASQERELTAFLASGVSVRRIARAPVVFAMAATVIVFVLQETWGVSAVKRHNDIKRKYFSKITDRDRVGVSWTNLSDGWTCHVLKFNLRANSGQGVFMHAIRDTSLEEIRAERIYWDAEQQAWLLEDGRWAVFDQERQWEAISTRITQAKAPFRETPEQLFALNIPAQSKTSAQLSRDISNAAMLGIPIREHLVNYHSKFAQPALCFIIVWLAIPFAIRLQKGSITAGFGISIAMAMAYLLLFSISIGLGYMGKLPPAVAAWLANVIFMLFGYGLYRMTPT